MQIRILLPIFWIVEIYHYAHGERQIKITYLESGSEVLSVDIKFIRIVEGRV